jgi:hypothetical protein
VHTNPNPIAADRIAVIPCEAYPQGLRYPNAQRTKRRKAPPDVIGNAIHVMRIATGETE